MTYILVLLVSFSVFAENKRNLPVHKDTAVVKKEMAKKNAAVKKEEDCDKKAKKPIEIKEETISLGSGATGCVLTE